MTTTSSQPDDVWFVDEGASNPKPGMVETSDESPHTIEHIGDAAFNNHDNKGYIKDVLHVSTITKNLVPVGEIDEQGMQV